MFKVGDKVSWMGAVGTVTWINKNKHPFFKDGCDVIANFDGSHYKFEADGRYLPWHTEPSLKLVERGKEKSND